MNNQVKFAIIAIIITIPLISFGVFSSDPNQSKKTNESKLQVMSSFYPLHEFSQKVGQDKVDVKLLVPVGIEPHDWEPTIKDVQQMQKSDLIIINGIGFESWTDKLTEINYQGIIVDTSNGIIEKNIEESSINENVVTLDDPHIWLNPVYAKIQVQNIADAFSKSDPENEKYYKDNAANYITELDLLDLKIRNELSNCNQDFIAFHDAFSYFSKEYGLTQYTILPSNTPHAEPTAKTLENVINKAKDLNLDVIFTEETADPKTSQVIANEIGGRILVLSPLEIGDDGTYISRMTENLNNLKEALC
ncbi:metal ABC transporter substrate-binding protein [Nitrosarchaeum sp.]|uniref:metal ABC transporter substrate-binding protein n=1 Tax=Nitrosarchaeum sp. TaxID=2026886 RepID=UPI00247CC519|nr:metal ABC transporter substrate-binding protein [Nitrosarchaeum sp.]MCV0412452.1 metal ABC transporter substrate-binding protein [Nitrosarchaeum sp.]